LPEPSMAMFNMVLSSAAQYAKRAAENKAVTFRRSVA